MTLKAIVTENLYDHNTHQVSIADGDVVEVWHLDREQGRAWVSRDYDDLYVDVPARCIVLIGEQRSPVSSI